MSSRLSFIAFASCLLLAPLGSAQTKRALLIGINTYTPEKTTVIRPGDNQVHASDSRFAEGQSWPNLEGPENDVEDMAAVLPSFGFSEIHKLKGQAATRGEILAEIDQYIVREPRSGDTVLFYFAGHGSQRLNSKSSKMDHLDETIVPADAYRGAFDIRDKELARAFNRALDNGLHVVAIFDSCHSGTMARGLKFGRARWLAYDDRDAADGGNYGTPDAPQFTPPAERGAIIIAAALSTQTADEIPDANGDMHGLFTEALIRALRNSTPAWSTLDVVNAADGLLKADGWTQQPSVEGPSHRSLWGDFAVAAVRANIVKVVSPDEVMLSAGSAQGFGPGSQFASQTRRGLVLEIIAVTGPASSRAKISSGQASDLNPGDLFQMTRLAVPHEAKLTVFVPEIVSDEQWRRIRDEIRGLPREKEWSPAADPVTDMPTRFVYWTSSGWTVASARGETSRLGMSLTSDALSKMLGHGGKLYLSLPPSRSLIDALKQQSGFASGVIDLSTSLADSQYILIGRLSSKPGVGAEYALALPGLFGALNPASMVRSAVDTKTVVCSSESDLPLRTDWTEVENGSAAVLAAAAEIEAAALKLGRNRAWLRTASHDQDGSWPYRLAITRTDSDEPLGKAPLAAGSQYDISLVADRAVLQSHGVEPRYVYLFGLQCDGRGQLLYPSPELGGGAPLPVIVEGKNSGGSPDKIKLAHLEVSPPLGLDTVVLLASRDRISDLGAFSYSGVINQGARGVSNELEDLIRGISGQSRGMATVSATWSIQRASISSH
jgi:uncharacterized caspase-like protein